MMQLIRGDGHNASGESPAARRAGSLMRALSPPFVISVVVVAATSCSSAQLPAAQLKAGVYDCVAVFVNQSGKFEAYVDDAWSQFTGFARVQDGQVTSYSAPNALGWQSDVEIVVRKSGSSRFHATQDPAAHSYDALACEWAEQD